MSEPETSRSEDTSEPPDLEHMFTSVWVKVEVDEYTQPDINLDLKQDNDTQKTKKKKKCGKTLNCDKCDYTTRYKNCLQLHVLKHSDSVPLQCASCEYTTRYPTSLQRHVLIKHNKDNAQNETLKCDQCSYTSNFKWNLNAHKRKHKLVKQFKCDHCPYETAYRNSFTKHSKIHKADNVDTVFKCDKCPFMTRYEGHITRHLNVIHNELIEEAFKCDYCDFATKIKWRLNIHVNRSKQQNTLVCPYCDFRTDYQCQLKKHKLSHFKEIVRCKYRKPKPNRQTDQENLDADQIAKNDPKETILNRTVDIPYPNTEKLSAQYSLDPDCLDWNNIHVSESDDKEKPFSCIMCSYTSKFKASVQRHFQRHHTGSQNRPYKCCNCDFSTKTKDQIALHNKRSISTHPLFCGDCNFATYYKCLSIMHQKSHHENKCSKCEYTCKNKTELQRHYACMHLGKGMKCNYCDYTAARKESLLCHETIHTGVKPYSCGLCQYSSVRKSLLDNHMKRYHSEVPKCVTIVPNDKIKSLKVSLSDEIKNIQDVNIENVSKFNANIIDQRMAETGGS